MKNIFQLQMVNSLKQVFWLKCFCLMFKFLVSIFVLGLT